MGQLVVAGLAGGKGVPDSVAGHPTLFVTLTAPSFGPVHARVVNDQGQTLPCRARRDEADEVCEHGQPTTGMARHAEDDPCLGHPLCPECWDYAGAVLWNAHASELWRRTRIRVYRELAALTGLSERQLRREVSVSYVKVAEYQKRGLVHFHLLIRLDAAQSPRCSGSGCPGGCRTGSPRPRNGSPSSCSPKRSAPRSRTWKSPTPTTSSERVKGRRLSRRESARHP
ncbi:MAG: replication initiator [Egibacteraceae bacterium]